MSSELEYEKILNHLEKSHSGISGQMFGKKCIKINNKAGVALFKEFLVFKLTEPMHSKAIALSGSELWDPSGKGRPMKEWVQVTMEHKNKFVAFANAAADYVGGQNQKTIVK